MGDTHLNFWMVFQLNCPHNLPSCGWLWLTSHMGQPLFEMGLTCVCVVPGDSHFRKGGPNTNIKFFHYCLKHYMNDTINIIPYRYKTWMGFVWQISMKLESSSNRVFSSATPWSPLESNWCNMEWPPSDKWSMHSVCGKMCGSAAMYLIGVFHTMKHL